MVYTDVENTTLVLVGLHGVAQTASDRRRTTEYEAQPRLLSWR
jgi:hypothetical protein